MQTPIHVFLPSFAEIGKAEVTKRVSGIRHKNVGILPLCLWLLERSRQKFYRITLSPVPRPDAKFCPNPFRFRGDISENVFQTH